MGQSLTIGLLQADYGRVHLLQKRPRQLLPTYLVSF